MFSTVLPCVLHYCQPSVTSTSLSETPTATFNRLFAPKSISEPFLLTFNPPTRSQALLHIFMRSQVLSTTFQHLNAFLNAHICFGDPLHFFYPFFF